MRFFAIHRVTCVSLDDWHVGASWTDNCSVVFSSILDYLSFRWFTRSNVSGVDSVNLMASIGRAGLVF